MEETKERVKVRSAAATEVASGSKELGDHIARLMAALTRVEQDSHPASAPNSPQVQGLWERVSRQEYPCLPQLPQWLD